MNEAGAKDVDVKAVADRNPVPPFIYHAARILLGLVFIIASLDKIERPWDFGRAVYVYHVLDGSLAYLISPLAIIMPLIELVTGVLMIVNRWVRPAALLIFGMNVVFIIAIISVIARGMDIDCGCGLDVGILATIAGTQADLGALLRDFVILALNLIVLFAPQSRGK
jgi:putative oxidoreductase